MDTVRLRKNFARVAMHGDEVTLFFYSDLFLRHPELREMFPVSMAAQRDHLVRAIATIVSDVGRLDQLAPYLQELGRDHRKFGTLSVHYEPLRASLLAALAYFSGEDWTPELAADWREAYGLVSQIMIESAAADEKVNPAFWDATVISHELRTFDTAVFRLAPLDRLRYLPGQSVAIESQLRPRVWRFSALAPWLTVTPCVSDEPDYRGERGLLPDVVARSGSWPDRDAYLAGPTPMVEGMAAMLAAQGVPAEQIHIEDFGWSEP